MKLKKKLLIGVGTVLTLVAILYINFFIWPFTTSRPNYSDVEKAFDDIKFPNGWTVSETTVNKGIAGRACPLEGSGCYSKRAVVKLPEGVDSAVFTSFLNDIGCSSVSVSDSSSKSIKIQTYYCNLQNGIKLGSDFKVDNREASITVFTE